MSEEEILIALKEIHARYCIPASEQNYTDKDYACMQYEKLVIHLQKEIERLNNIINKGIEAINVYQNEKTLSIGYQDLKRIRGILRGNEFDLKIFEEYLQELKGVDKE